MATTTYSFADIHCVISPGGVKAPFTINGSGIGEISVSLANDNTSHDLAADGSVMISKIKADNGTITIRVQQTSPLHAYLKSVYNALRLLPASAWASIVIYIGSPNGLFDSINCTNVAFTKRPDQPYQQQGQNVTWSFMAANIQYQF